MAKSSKRDLPKIEGVSGETPDGTVWAEVKVSLRPGDYESVGVTLGQSLRIEGSRRNRREARKQLLAELVREVVPKAVEVRETWREQTT
jgi:hypothetical protein